MSRDSWKITAVVLGSLVSIGGTLIVGTLIMVVASASLVAGGVSHDQVGNRMMSFNMLAIQTVVGTGFILLGGYVAARTSKVRQVQHALASGIPWVLLGLVLGRGAQPIGFWVSFYVLLFPSAALGGFWARSRNRVLPSGTFQPR